MTGRPPTNNRRLVCQHCGASFHADPYVQALRKTLADGSVKEFTVRRWPLRANCYVCVPRRTR